MRSLPLAPCCLAALGLLCVLGCDDDRPPNSSATVNTAGDAGGDDASSDTTSQSDASPEDVLDDARWGPSDVDDDADDTSPGEDATRDAPADVDIPDIGDDAPDTSADAPSPDATGDTVEDVVDPGEPCETLGATRACLERRDCVVEQSLADLSYVCRPSVGDCEGLDADGCEAREGCVFNPGSCFCPEDVVCGCGGGHPPICRAEDAEVQCRGDRAGFCSPGTLCCGVVGQQVGDCVAEEDCDASPCDPVVQVVHRGGLCEDGACISTFTVHADHYLLASNEAPNSAVGGVLTDEEWRPIRNALDAVDPFALEDGYGACCNSHSDGSDAYLTFFRRGEPVREVRVSDLTAAPSGLNQLLTSVNAAGYARLNGEVEATTREACPE